jgi:hypothetical protein
MQFEGSWEGKAPQMSCIYPLPHLYISRGAYTQYIHTNYNNSHKFKTQIAPMYFSLFYYIPDINIHIPVIYKHDQRR